MTRILSALVLALAAVCAYAQDTAGVLAESAPNRYVVASGDTLWGIAARFLKDPWRWPELWRMNREQVRHPGRIHPGDVIVLERDGDGSPYLRLETIKLQPTIHATRLAPAIPPIPPNAIEPFISAPLIVEAGELEHAARIVATQQDRVFLGNGDLAYVENAAPEIALWQVYRNGRPLYDPENPKDILGYEAFHLGTAKQIRAGAPATFEIQAVKQEIGRGDRLVPASVPMLFDYIPHRPDRAIEGRVISIYGGVGSAGRGSIISLSRGDRDGLEVGHVLVVERNRTMAGRDEKDRAYAVTIPREQIGLAFVFKSFSRISYALILQSEGTVNVSDYVRTP